MIMRSRFICLYLLAVVNAVNVETKCRAYVATNVGNSSGYATLAEHLERSVDYTADPCEDFYRFACNNWIRVAEKPQRRFSMYDGIQSLLMKQEESLLQSHDFEESRSMKAAQQFFKRCLSSDREWSSNGGPITFVLRRIRGYGGFPIVDGPLWQEQHHDLTGLLAYFNKHSITTPALVPHFRPKLENSSEMMIAFHPRETILSRLRGQSMLHSIERIKSTSEFRLFMSIVRQICKTATKACNKSRVETELLELSQFTILINDIVKSYLAQDLHLTTLEDIDNITRLVNWTTYLNEIAPRSTAYISSNMVVAATSEEYFERLDSLLRIAPERVVTNYVMMMYILNWIEYLDKDYRRIVRTYANDVQPRQDLCASQTWHIYGSAMLAAYAHQYNGREVEDIGTRMTDQLLAEFEDVVRSNTWADRISKQVILQRLKSMEKVIAYQSHHFNLSSLDVSLKDYIREEDFEEKTFLEIKETFDRGEIEVMFRCLHSCNVIIEAIRSLEDLMNSFNSPAENRIEVGVGMFQFPYFGARFPMSFNYGGIGSVIGHEMAHNVAAAAASVDENGNIKKVLGDEFLEQFAQRAQCFINHYHNAEVLLYENGKVKKTHLRNNAKFTLREDIADHGGLQIAFKAYQTHKRKHGHEARFANNQDFDSDQMFFLGYATKHCARYSFEGLKQQLTTNEHSLEQLRVNKVVANNPAFAEAFHCAPGKKLNPPKRCDMY